MPWVVPPPLVSPDGICCRVDSQLRMTLAKWHHMQATNLMLGKIQNMTAVQPRFA